MKMYGRKACRLVKDIASGEKGQLTPFSENGGTLWGLIHHLSLVRNKPCLMTFLYIRAEILRTVMWKVGSVIPGEIKEKLRYSEKAYIAASLKNYM